LVEPFFVVQFLLFLFVDPPSAMAARKKITKRMGLDDDILALLQRKHILTCQVRFRFQLLALSPKRLALMAYCALFKGFAAANRSRIAIRA
jgi:hypothetical protein